jgi:hypothetical protein
MAFHLVSIPDSQTINQEAAGIPPAGAKKPSEGSEPPATRSELLGRSHFW